MRITEHAQAELNTRFTHHPPDKHREAVHSLLRGWHKDLAEVILQHCHPSDETDMAVLKIEEALMWANASVARRGTPSTKEEIEGVKG